MRLLVLGFLVFLTIQVHAQTQRSAARSAAPARSSAPAKQPSAAAHFSASGLNNEDDLLRIYSGDFGSVRLDRGGMEFMLIISGYMEDFAKECKQFLPPNKVEIMQQVCEGSGPSNTYSPDGVHDIYGNVIQPTSCTYVTRGTGLYADPQLYDAEQDVGAKAQANMLRNMLGMGKRGAGSNPFSAPQQAVDQLTAVGNEMETLIHVNACGSAGLRNFQSNLIRFANGDAPVTYAGAAGTPPAPGSAGGPAKDADYTRLVNDLVAANARGWMMNRYQPGSISEPLVQRDPLGHPVRITAQYSYAGMQGTQRGRVVVSFKDGSPDCLYFSDSPDTCRLPADGVVSAYEKNAYAK
ncbi:MAG TPA: hypothetical protein VFW30_06225 [Bryocella sp.]|nr:hypothetical protein [Bryocella sp.]